MAAESALDLRYLLQNQEETPGAIQCTVTGDIPQWLSGSLLRNGPGMFHIGPDSYKHLFDGLALIHKWHIHDGKVDFTSRYLRSNTYERNTRANRIVVSEFGTRGHPDPCKSLFDRYFSYYFGGEMTDNALVNFIQCGDQVYAATETPVLCRIDPGDMSTLANNIDIRKAVAVNTTTAHPHYLPDGSVINMGMGNGTYHLVKFAPPRAENDLLRHAVHDASTLCQIKFSTVYPSYYHSFAMTENNLVFVEMPLKVNLFKLFTNRLRGVPFSDIFEWYDGTITKIHLRSLATGEPINDTVYTADPFFTFHHCNAYESRGCIVCDVCAYDNGDIIEGLTLDDMRKGVLPSGGTLRRLVLPLSVPDGVKAGDDILPTLGVESKARAVLQSDGSIHCSVHTVCDLPFEFPRINYAYNGRPYHYCYGSGAVFDNADVQGILKIDVDSGERQMWRRSGSQICGEPVFVPRPGAEAEDDGVILAPVMTTKADEQPFLLVLDAANMEELARAHQSVTIPFAFHAHYLCA